MKWIEVIELRSTDSTREQLDAKMYNLIEQIENDEKDQDLKIYTRMLIDTDFSVHLFHDTEVVEKIGSQLGLRIASALRMFGMVNHSIWIERSKNSLQDNAVNPSSE